MKQNLLLLLSAFMGIFSVQAQEEISPEDIKYWVGEGQDSTVLLVDFKDGNPAVAFGYLHNEEATGADLLNAIDKEYPYFEVVTSGDFLLDVSYKSQVREGGEPDWFSAFSKTTTTDWAYNDGLTTTLGNNDFFGLAYNTYPAPNDSLPNVSNTITPLPEISLKQVEYWVGEGEDSTLLIVDFKDGEPALAIGYLHDEEATGTDLLEAIQSEYPNFEVVTASGFLSDIIYKEQKAEGGNPNWFSTFSKTKTTDWAYNSGLTTTLGNNNFFGLAYNTYPAPNDSLPNQIVKYISPIFDQTEAISNTDDAIVNWANGIELVRGKNHISDDTASLASFGEKENALNAAEGTATDVVSLGDAGYAILTFPNPIKNGEGADFAVFENGFGATFLELAFVEVSSDGENFFRFPSISLTQTETQLGGFGEINPNQIHNLAGKFMAGLGAPFDLEELAGIDGLDIDQITHVKIIDVVGSIDPDYASFDSKGNIINDPFSTPFASSGFDLDGVAVLHENTEASTIDFITQNTKVYPTIVENEITVETNRGSEVTVLNQAGQIVVSETIEGTTQINLEELAQGFYIVHITNEEGQFTQKVLVK